MKLQTKIRKRSRSAGFTLIEMLIVMLVFGIIMGAVFTQINTAEKRSSAEQQKLDMFQETREFADTIARDLRNAGYPNKRNFTAALTTDTNNAQGLLYVGPADVWFEGAVDGDSRVYVVKYHLDSTGTNCPCLRRSKQPKVATGMPSDDYSVEVQFVQNGTLALPIFSYYKADNSVLDLSTYSGNVIDGTAAGADTATLSSIQTVKIELSTLAKYADLQTGLRPVITLDSFVTLPNCSQLGTGSVRC